MTRREAKREYKAGIKNFKNFNFTSIANIKRDFIFKTQTSSNSDIKKLNCVYNMNTSVPVRNLRIKFQKKCETLP